MDLVQEIVVKMKLKVLKTEKLEGEIIIPASKSHTIRAIVIASLANGKTVIKNPLESEDTQAALNAAEALGAKIAKKENKWEIDGFSGKPTVPKNTVNIGNSGTTLRLFTSVAALADNWITFDGDESIRERPMLPLLDSLEKLGVKVKSNDGKCPLSVKGPILGGKTSINAVTSQFLSSLLLVSPYAKKDVEIDVEALNEIPYVNMTLKWLNDQGIIYENKDMKHFSIKSGQKHKAFEKQIPADWSSATFPICACAITQSNCKIKDVDFEDVQGDKRIVDILQDMGVKIMKSLEELHIKGNKVQGSIIDLNDIPDSLPALSVLGCFANNETQLINVPQARIKETDRIKVMTEELTKMGADIEEKEDGMIIRQKELKGAEVSGHNDHRIVMALTLAGLIADGETVIDRAESINITYPSFVEDMRSLGARIKLI